MAAWILACVAGCNWRQPGLGFAAALALVAEGARVLLSAPHEATAATAVARLTQYAAPGAGGYSVTHWTRCRSQGC